MKKKILIAIIVILVIALIAVGAYFIFFNKEKTLDINVANQTLANSYPFNELATMDVTTEELGTVMGVNTENIENVVGKIPMMNVQASMYLLV